MGDAKTLGGGELTRDFLLLRGVRLVSQWTGPRFTPNLGVSTFKRELL